MESIIKNAISTPRRLLCFILSAAALALCCFRAGAVEIAPDFRAQLLSCGDADGNGIITIADAGIVQRRLAEFSHAFPYNIPKKNFVALCDANADGELTISDVTAIQRYLAELNTDGAPIGKRVFAPEEVFCEDGGELYSVYEAACRDFTFDSVTAPVAEFLAGAPYSPDYSRKIRADRPNKIEVYAPKNAYEAVIDNGKTRRTIPFCSEAVSSLAPGTYSYCITDKFGVWLQAGVIRVNGRLRMIDAGGGTFNIRDLGGWRCDGGTMRYGMIYRGCELDSDNYNITLTEKQRTFFTEYLQIKDDIDLRGDAEVDGLDKTVGTDDDIKSSALGEAVDYIRLPLAPYTIGVNLGNHYQMNYYAAMLSRIARDVSEGKPCYIHCMAGADRTGTLCALIEAICGMSQDDIESEFELTSFARGHYRSRTDADWQKLIAFLNSLEGETLRDKTIAYALAIGVSMDEINALRCGMIEKFDSGA